MSYPPLKLRVVDVQNRPIKGAWVIPDNWRAPPPCVSCANSASPPKPTSKGSGYGWTPLSVSRLDLTFSNLRSATCRDDMIAVNHASVEKTIVLKQPQIITGTVIGARTKEPVPEFVVERAFENVAGHPDGLYWAHDDMTGKNGTYLKQVSMPPHNGSYTYRVRAPAYETLVGKSIPFTVGETAVEFELHRKSTVKPD